MFFSVLSVSLSSSSLLSVSSVMDDVASLGASLFPRAAPMAGEEAAVHHGQLEA